MIRGAHPISKGRVSSGAFWRDYIPIAVAVIALVVVILSHNTARRMAEYQSKPSWSSWSHLSWRMPVGILANVDKFDPRAPRGINLAGVTSWAVVALTNNSGRTFSLERVEVIFTLESDKGFSIYGGYGLLNGVFATPTSVLDLPVSLAPGHQLQFLVRVGMPVDDKVIHLLEDSTFDMKPTLDEFQEFLSKRNLLLVGHLLEQFRDVVGTRGVLSVELELFIAGQREPIRESIALHRWTEIDSSAAVQGSLH
jgi:hypothetical protein